jgi:hypothetical protein
LEQLIDVLTQPNELDQASQGNLIRNLYPASKVGDGIIVKVVLGHGRAKPSYATQAAFLKWVVMVYDVLENQKVLSRFYGILFNLLDALSIRYDPFASVRKILTLLDLKYATCYPSSHGVNMSGRLESKSCGFLDQRVLHGNTNWLKHGVDTASRK